MRTKVLLTIVHTLICFAGLTQQIHIKIIESSDVHGAIFPFDDVNKHKQEGSLSKVANYVKAQRNNSSQSCILIDNGDILQGDPAVYFYNSPDSSKNLMAEVMNYMHYDLMNVGNHDIEQGHPVYDKFRKEANFPLISANTRKTQNDSCYFKAYKVIERKGVKIAFLGLITHAIPQWLPENLYEGMYFEDMIESARYWVRFIRENENPDILVGVFHSGVDYTYGGQTANSPFNENASELVAREVPGFNLIFVGHDHHGWNKSIRNVENKEVYILGPTSKARNLAIADLYFDEQKVLASIHTEIAEMGPIEADPDFIRHFRSQENNLANKLNTPICSLSTDLVSREALFGNSSFVDLIHQVQLEASGAEISFASSNSFNQVIRAGAFSFADLFKMYKYENTLYTMHLKGSEIKDYLEYSYGNWFEQIDGNSSHLLKFKVDSFGETLLHSGRPVLSSPFYNFDCAAGIRYEVHLDQSIGHKIKIISMADGSAFDINKRYLVCMNSYRANGGGSLLEKGSGLSKEEREKRIAWRSEKEIRWLIYEYLKSKGKYLPVQKNNVQFFPQAFYKKLVNKDYLLLFGD